VRATRQRWLRSGARSAALLLPLLLLAPGIAQAALGSTRVATQGVAVARWSVVMTVGTPTSNPVTPGTTGAVTVPLDADSFVWGNNNGTATLDNGYRITLPMTATGGATAELDQCSGGSWDEVADTCSGTVTSVAVTGGTNPYTLTSGYPPGYGIRFRVHPLAYGAGNTVTVGASVTAP
jgi:hypothetical protein